MSNIQKIYLRNMRNGVHFQFIEDVLKITDGNTKVKEKCAKQIEALTEAHEAEDVRLKVSTKSLLTDTIREYDEKRDSLYAKYKKAVKAFEDFPEEELAGAAKPLLQSIKDYNINSRTSLQQQSGLFSNLISDLEGPLAAHIATLRLGKVVSEMKAANERVKELMLERGREESSRESGSLKNARTECDKWYYALVEMVDAMALLEGTEEYASFINHINVTITSYKRNAMNQKAAATKNIAGPDEGDTPGGEDTPGTGGTDTPPTGGDEGGGNEGGGSDFD